MGDQDFNDAVPFRNSDFWTTHKRYFHIKWNSEGIKFNNEFLPDEGVLFPRPEYSLIVRPFFIELHPDHQGILNSPALSNTEKGYVCEGIAHYYFNYTNNDLSSAPADGFEWDNDHNTPIITDAWHRPNGGNVDLFNKIMRRRVEYSDQLTRDFRDLQFHNQLIDKNNADPFELKYTTSTMHADGTHLVANWTIPSLQYYNIIANYGVLACITQFNGTHILGITLESIHGLPEDDDRILPNSDLKPNQWKRTRDFDDMLQDHVAQRRRLF